MTEAETDKQIGRQRERDRDSDRDRQLDRQTNRERCRYNYSNASTSRVHEGLSLVPPEKDESNVAIFDRS